jgi:hypothetical protein
MAFSYLSLSLSLYIYIYICVCVCVCARVCVYSHTHTHYYVLYSSISQSVNCEGIWLQPWEVSRLINYAANEKIQHVTFYNFCEEMETRDWCCHLYSSCSSAIHLKKWQKCWEWCICTEWDYFEGDGGQSNFFYQMAAPVPEIMDDPLYICLCTRVCLHYDHETLGRISGCKSKLYLLGCGKLTSFSIWIYSCKKRKLACRTLYFRSYLNVTLL